MLGLYVAGAGGFRAGVVGCVSRDCKAWLFVGLGVDEV